MEKTLAKNIKRAEFIKKERKKREWPQSQLAEIAGVNLRTIQRIEKGESASYETLKGVAAAFDIDVTELNQALDDNQKVNSQRRVYHLPRLITGKHLTKVIEGTDRLQFEHDEAFDQKSLGAMRDILELLKRDVIRLYDADPIERLQFESELTQEIEGLGSYGFYLFGIKRIIPKIDGRLKSETTMSTLFVSHSRSPKIVRDKNSNMMVPAILTEFVK